MTDTNGLQQTAATAAPAPLLNAGDVAAILCISERQVWRLCSVGMLRKVQLGRRTVRFKPEDIAALIDSRLLLAGGLPVP